MKLITLTKGYFAKIDDSDFEEISKHRWCYSKGYAVRGIRNRIEGWQRQICMHRVVNKTPDGFMTDHINRDKLDNRKENLRTTTMRGNQLNRKHLPVGSYKYKKKWISQIKIKGKPVYLGYFETQEEASKRFLEARKEYENVR